MDDKMDAKKIGMIAFVIAALIIAAVVIYKTVQSQQPQIVKTVDGGKSPKLQSMEAQKSGKSAEGSERDPNAAGDKSQ